MTKEQQNLIWSYLPKEIRNELKKKYFHTFSESASEMLEFIFGAHNLTSNIEIPEMLSLPKKRIQELYSGYVYEISKLPVLRENEPDLAVVNRTSLGARKSLLEELYTRDECLGMFMNDVVSSDSEVYPKFHKNDVVTVKDGRNNPYQGIIQEVIRGVTNGFIYKLRCSEEYIPEIYLEKYSEENKTLLEKYWKDGNIFEFNTGHKRMVWGDRVIDRNGFIWKQSLSDDLVNQDNLKGEFVIKVYPPNMKALHLGSILDVNPNDPIWKKSEYIYTERELKEKLGIPEDQKLIITE